MATVISAHYDFASTICYVTHRCLGRWQADLDELGVALEWRPLDLVRITGWARGVEVEGVRRENALRVAQEFDVEVHMPARWLDSRSAHAIALSLAGTPKEEAWRERVQSAVFEEGRDIGETAEIERLAADIGLRLDVDAGHLAALDRATIAAGEAGLTGVPALDLGGWFLPGLQDRQTMRLVIERYLRRIAARAAT